MTDRPKFSHIFWKNFKSFLLSKGAHAPYFYWPSFARRREGSRNKNSPLLFSPYLRNSFSTLDRERFAFKALFSLSLFRCRQHPTIVKMGNILFSSSPSFSHYNSQEDGAVPSRCIKYGIQRLFILSISFRIAPT